MSTAHEELGTAWHGMAAKFMMTAQKERGCTEILAPRRQELMQRRGRRSPRRSRGEFKIRRIDDTEILPKMVGWGQPWSLSVSDGVSAGIAANCTKRTTQDPGTGLRGKECIIKWPHHLAQSERVSPRWSVCLSSSSFCPLLLLFFAFVLFCSRSKCSFSHRLAT